MIIAIDLDEVLSATLPRFIDLYNSKHNTQFGIADFHSYYWSVVLQTSIKEVEKEVENMLFNHNLSIKPIKGAKEAIQKLSNHELHIVTSRRNEYEKPTREWLDHYFPKIFTKIHIANHAHWATSGKTLTKKEICKEINADILIEDNTDYIIECQDLRMKFFLFNYPWNQQKPPQNTIRVKLWKDIISVLN